MHASGKMRVFSFFIHTSDSTVPTLLFELLSDEKRARLLAEKAFTDAPNRIAVEVREDDRLLFSLDRNGVSWRRRDASDPRPARPPSKTPTRPAPGPKSAPEG